MSSPLLVDILAYWNLNNNGSGGVSLVDSTGNGNALTNSGTTLGSGIIAGGANASIADGQLVHSSIITDPCSISIWFKADGTASTDGSIIIFSDMGYGFQCSLNNGTYGPDGSVDFIMWQGDGSNIVISSLASTYGDNSWHHFVATIDGTNANLYLDGVLQGTSPYSGHSTPWSPSFPFQFPGYVNNGWLPTGGYLTDEVGVWNRALSQADVTALYNSGSGLTYPFVVTLYYNNAENDGDWGNLLNWWQDSGFTIQATALPNDNNSVAIYGEVIENTAGDGVCYCKSADFYSSSFYYPLILNSIGVVNFYGTGGVFDGTATDGISFHDTCSLGENGYITGNATFRDQSTNSLGTVHGNAFFYEQSYNFGQIDGNATVYYSGGQGSYPIGGTVTGSVTYLDWPAVSPQYFNDNPSIGGAGDGDFNNPLNWWTDDNYNVRPINSVGTQQIPNASTDVVIAPSRAIYANTGTEPLINSLTANNAELVYITITISNGATFGGDSWGMYQAVVYGNVTFNSGSYNSEGVIYGTAKYTSSQGIQYAWYDNSLVNLNSTPMAYGSTGFQISISEGGDVLISRLLNLPWFINI